MQKNFDLLTVKDFILANALTENVMLMLHPSNFDKLLPKGNKARLVQVSGINVIPDDTNEITEDEIDILEVKFN